MSVEQLACRHRLGADQSSLLDGGELDEVTHGPTVCEYPRGEYSVGGGITATSRRCLCPTCPAEWAIIRGWAAAKSGGNATTDEFIALAEQVSGRQLDELFETWLFTASKPVLAASGAAMSTQASPETSASPVPARGATWLADLERRLEHGHF